MIWTNSSSSSWLLNRLIWWWFMITIRLLNFFSCLSDDIRLISSRMSYVEFLRLSCFRNGSVKGFITFGHNSPGWFLTLFLDGHISRRNRKTSIDLWMLSLSKWHVKRGPNIVDRDWLVILFFSEWDISVLRWSMMYETTACKEESVITGLSKTSSRLTAWQSERHSMMLNMSLLFPLGSSGRQTLSPSSIISKRAFVNNGSGSSRK